MFILWIKELVFELFFFFVNIITYTILFILFAMVVIVISASYLLKCIFRREKKYEKENTNTRKST